MRKFETLLLLSPELSAENHETIVNGLVAVIEREGGSNVVVDRWGIKNLAYPVRKLMRGLYVRLEYCGPHALVAELERNIRIIDGIFKFMTVRLADIKAEEVA